MLDVFFIFILSAQDVETLLIPSARVSSIFLSAVNLHQIITFMNSCPRETSGARLYVDCKGAVNGRGEFEFLGDQRLPDVGKHFSMYRIDLRFGKLTLLGYKNFHIIGEIGISDELFIKRVLVGEETGGFACLRRKKYMELKNFFVNLKSYGGGKYVYSFRVTEGSFVKDETYGRYEINFDSAKGEVAISEKINIEFVGGFRYICDQDRKEIETKICRVELSFPPSSSMKIVCTNQDGEKADINLGLIYFSVPNMCNPIQLW